MTAEPPATNPGARQFGPHEQGDTSPGDQRPSTVRHPDDDD